MGPSTVVETFDRSTLLGRRWYFRIVDAGNHEILSASEAYNSRPSRNRTASRLALELGCRIIEGKRK
jgi:hypothetical protein